MSFVMTEEMMERLEAFGNQVHNIGGVVVMAERLMWDFCVTEDMDTLKLDMRELSCLAALLRESIKTQEEELNQITKELYRSQSEVGDLSA